MLERVPSETLRIKVYSVFNYNRHMLYLFIQLCFIAQRIWLIFDEDVSKLNQSEWEKKNTLLWRQVLFTKTLYLLSKTVEFYCFGFIISQIFDTGWPECLRCQGEDNIEMMGQENVQRHVMLSSSSELLLSLFWHSSQCSRPGTLILIVIYIQ